MEVVRINHLIKNPCIAITQLIPNIICLIFYKLTIVIASVGQSSAQLPQPVQMASFSKFGYLWFGMPPLATDMDRQSTGQVSMQITHEEHFLMSNFGIFFSF